MRKISYLNLIMVFACLNLMGQTEICDNCIDDDGDGLIDCYDLDCLGKTGCQSFFMDGSVVDSACIKETDQEDIFVLEKLWSSQVVIDTRHTTVAGDLDGDGIPEVISYNYLAPLYNQLYIIDGLTGNTKVHIDKTRWIFERNSGAAIADVDNDGDGEIFVNTRSGILMSFDHLGNKLWESSSRKMDGDFSCISPNLADFNGDGIPEVYGNGKIYNALTGEFIAEASGSLGKLTLSTNPGNKSQSYTVAADVLPFDAITCPDCDGLELVAGNYVFGVDIPNKKITLRAQAPSGLLDGFTSVADIDLDGQLDIIVNSGKFNIYVWNPRTKTQMGPTYVLTNGDGGRPTVANLDDDPELEIAIAGSKKFVVLDNNMTELWTQDIRDGSSHISGSTLFDFNCDNKFEIVYRDQDSLYIFDGSTGEKLASSQCGSSTFTEVPVVVDVDGDGNANIVCSCSPSSNNSQGRVVAFKAKNNNWSSTRKVFNQNNYAVTNVNDDLTIPCQQQNNAVTSLPKNLNAYSVQSPLLDANGNPKCFEPLNDISVLIDSIGSSPCADSAVVYLQLCNNSSVVFNEILSLAFYNGDPLSSGVLILTKNILKPISGNVCISYSIAIPEGNYPLYVFVNDDGTNPLSAPNVVFQECDTINNSDFSTVKYFDLSPISFVVSDSNGCAPLCVVFNNSSSAQWENCSWDFGDGNSSDSCITSYCFETPGSYTPVLTVSDSLGCIAQDSIQNLITVFQNPLADFIYNPSSPNIIEPVVFSDASTGNVIAWEWDFDHPEDLKSVLSSFSVQYYDIDKYLVTLIVTDINNCSDTITKEISVDSPFLIYLPNAFTPNDDGKNDQFMVKGSQLNNENFNFYIYDRWGLLIFHSTDYNYGWDGTFKGKDAVNDTYIWKVVTIDENSESYEENGIVTLIH